MNLLESLSLIDIFPLSTLCIGEGTFSEGSLPELRSLTCSIESLSSSSLNFMKPPSPPF
jgi:hypothetical protein